MFAMNEVPTVNNAELTETEALAKPSTVSSIIPEKGSSPFMPSAPIIVVTEGVPDLEGVAVGVPDLLGVPDFEGVADGVPDLLGVIVTEGVADGVLDLVDVIVPVGVLVNVGVGVDVNVDIEVPEFVDVSLLL